MGKSKPYQVALEEDLASEVLNTPLPQDLPTCEPPPKALTIGEKLEQAREALQDAVRLANEVLSDQMMVDILARALAKDHKRRGDPSIVVLDDGSVVLRVTYEGSLDERQDYRPPLKRKKWSSSLPPLEELRERAHNLGIDISDLGRQKTAILQRLESAEGSA